jgi:hypothetical protein
MTVLSGKLQHRLASVGCQDLDEFRDVCQDEVQEYVRTALSIDCWL